jgi:hypothetical protein
MFVAGLFLSVGKRGGFYHRLIQDVADVKWRAMKEVAGLKSAVYKLGEMVESIQMVFMVADDKNIICGMRHRVALNLSHFAVSPNEIASKQLLPS